MRLAQNGNSAWWREYFIYEANKTLSSGSGTTFEDHTIKIDSDSNFEIMKTSYVATNDRIKVKLKDDALGRYLFKVPVDIKAIAGRNTLPMGLSNAFIPFIWPKPYLITAASTFTVEAADNSSASNVMRLAFHGAKVRPGRSPWDRNWRAIVPFVYGFSSSGYVSVTASSTAIGRIEIDNDAHFLCQKIVGIRAGAATVQVNEGARGREWSNAAVHFDNLVGNGSFPNILPQGCFRFIERGSVVSFNLTDLSGATNRVEINLIGVKLYE